ncbi:MAG: hypothetical protein AAFV93_01930 [Chloroflexota bacterium]
MISLLAQTATVNEILGIISWVIERYSLDTFILISLSITVAGTALFVFTGRGR